MTDKEISEYLGNRVGLILCFWVLFFCCVIEVISPATHPWAAIGASVTLSAVMTAVTVIFLRHCLSSKGKWQLISSVPKDGSEFLALDTYIDAMYVAHFNSEEDEWRIYIDPEGNENVIYGLTHWMPLPDLSKASKKGGA